MSLILCIETGTDICSVSLSKDGEVISLRESGEERNHGQCLGLYVEEMFKESEIDINNIDAVSVGMGPGSYTGLRIGVSLAKGIAYALSVPLIAIGSLNALMECAKQDIEESTLPKVSNKALFMPMLDARRMEVYSQTFNFKGETQTKVDAIVIDKDSFSEYKQEEIVLFGNGAKKVYDLLSDSFPKMKLYNVQPSARGLAGLSHQKFLNKEFVDVAYFEPMYLKNFIGNKSKRNPLEKHR